MTNRAATIPLLVDAPPQRLILRDAIASQFVARTKEEAGRKLRGLVSGCIYDSAGHRIDLSQRLPDLPGRMPLCRDAAQLDLSDPGIAGAQRLAGRTLYLGNFMNHYGHFITESLSRLWSSERMAEYDHIVAYPPNADGGQHLPQAFHRHFLSVLGLDLSRLEILRAPTRFDEICVPEQLWHINESANTHLRPLYRTIGERHRGPAQEKRIFLSRKELQSERLGSIAAIEAVFAAFGFAAYRPETIDTARQLQLYAGCEVLAAPSGSGMHNCLFTQPGTLTIELGDPRSPAAPPRMQCIADALAETKTQFVPYAGSGGGKTDVAALKARLADILGEKPSFARAVLMTLKRPSRLRTHFRRLRRRLQYGYVR